MKKFQLTAERSANIHQPTFESLKIWFNYKSNRSGECANRMLTDTLAYLRAAYLHKNNLSNKSQLEIDQNINEALLAISDGYLVEFS
ncbi:hypothetical protein AB4559_19920 [Vibrio sp. 10N.222.51.C8]|uniref:hypothetical protein n=1 Tax=unclassified Vibrio TaxID=2614977 RepID=UPI000C84F94B|nr:MULTISPECIES: hypothetical protein [unclassified Vibrio]PMO01649.1 hypothetical protein BCT20_11390 [Vibrio sp. 10N.222.55.C12]PMO02828.1 hypothetical protein BCT21_07290 [Vibrio sp. 10N.222.55.F9]PMO13588.1 hypothetical protein BCT17_14370 [Vibrio sp. 10N.222.54.F10]PMO14645.1 hypothetical protein BCT16_18850 [Vibrio sp. 10N.222.54.B6]TKF38529.1 hypothetical protein FCV49_21720 [Vibrio sp. F13]